MDASALVVGIDNYSNLPKLSGCTADALEAVDWLLSISVPPERIRLHVASDAAPSVPLGITCNSAKRDEIWSSILQIKEESGERLFVFLSGHGYYLSETGPIFLAEDWSSGFSDKNLNIDEYADYFQSLKFHNTMFVVDACQNYDMEPIYRSRIQASGPGEKTILNNPLNGVLLCCAASQGQYAPVVRGRGLLTRKLLEVLRAAPDDIPPVARDAYVYHWDTGAAQLDPCPLYKHIVAPWVTGAAASENHNMTPTIVPRGRLEGAEERITICDFPAVATVPLRVIAEPLQGLGSIAVALKPAARDLWLPPVPFQGVAPTGRTLIADCWPAVGWEADPPRYDITSITDDIDLRFDLRELPPDPERDSFNVKSVTGGGVEVFEVRDEDYLQIGVDRSAARAAVPGEPHITPNENGPDIAINGASLEVAEALAFEVRDALFELVSKHTPGVEFVIFRPGIDWKRSRPNLRLLLPEGGATALVGYLGSEPLIRIERVGQGGAEPVERFSADCLSRHAWFRLDPAEYRIVVDAPWGSASLLADIKEGPQVLSVPRPIGLPPLRNEASADTIDGEMMVPRPLGLRMLTSRQGGHLRAEPFSDLPWQEWDMLLGAGRLDAVDLGAATGRLRSAKDRRPDLDVLRLALAYAAWAQRKPELIVALLSELSPEYRDAPDALLLRLEAEDSSTSRSVLPPYFRWGALLLKRRAPSTDLPGVPSPYSVWSVYQKPALFATPIRRPPTAGNQTTSGDKRATAPPLTDAGKPISRSGGQVELKEVSKSYGSFKLINDISLTVKGGEFVVFVGPSGCGKSTLLRMIAGLEETNSGTILIDGRDVTMEPPAKRKLAMVFQSHALYPHMTVAKNIGFPLKMAGEDQATIEKKVADAARILNLTNYLERRPGQLSGGQRQRVAIGRAIVREPAAFLFDEPLSNLDAALRDAMRLEILELHERLGRTMIYVTHDQVEAMTMADTIVVLNAGSIEQVGSPFDLYRSPKSLFVAGFIGSPPMNFIGGAESSKRGATTIGVRPEHIGISTESGDWAGTIGRAEQLGADTFVQVHTGEFGTLNVRARGEMQVRHGDTVYLTPDPSKIYRFDADGKTI